MKRRRRNPRITQASAWSPPELPPPPNYAVMKKATLVYDTSTGITVVGSTAGLDRISKFDILVCGLGNDATALATRHAVLAGLRSRAAAQNKTIKVFAYIAYNEIGANMTSTSYEGISRFAKMQANPSWWLRKSTGERIRWSTGTAVFNNWDCLLNVDQPKDGSGRTWMQWAAEEATYRLASSGYDGAWLDNFQSLMALYIETGGDYTGTNVIQDVSDRTANYALDGVDRVNTNSVAEAIVANGHMQFVNTYRSLNSGVKIIGNSHKTTTWLARPELTGQLDGAFFEGWPRSGNASTIPLALSVQRANVVNTLSYPIVHAVVPDKNDYEEVRYRMCLALLDNSYFSLVATNNGGNTGIPPWYDEYDFDIGAPVDAPQTTPVATTVYARKYQNALVITTGEDGFSGRTAVRTYTPPPGIYKYPTGSQNPEVNSGAVITGSVTLDPRRGRILMCVTPGVHSL